MLKTHNSIIHLTWIINSIGDSVDAFNFIVPIPQKSPYQSNAKVISYFPSYGSIIGDRFEGNRFIKWKFNGLEPKSFIEVGLILEMKLYYDDSILENISISEVTNQQAASRYLTKAYLKSDVPIIHSIINNSNSLSSFLEKIYRIVYYKYAGRNDVWCSHYAYRTVQLLQAAGIPGRIAYGTSQLPRRGLRLFKSDDNQKFPTVGVKGSDGSAHTWAEIFIPNLGWIAVPQTYYPFSIRYSATAVDTMLKIREDSGREKSITLLGDAGLIYSKQVQIQPTMFNSNLIQIEFTCLIGPESLRYSPNNYQPKECPYLVGKRLNCMGYKRGIICCLFCPFRSRFCNFINNFEYWQKLCRNCDKIWKQRNISY